MRRVLFFGLFFISFLSFAQDVQDTPPQEAQDDTTSQEKKDTVSQEAQDATPQSMHESTTSQEKKDVPARAPQDNVVPKEKKDASYEEKKDAVELYKDGNYNEAIDVTLSEIKENPLNLDSYVVLSWSLMKIGEYQKVLLYAKEAQKIKAQDPRLIYVLAEANYYLKENDESLKYFFDYLQLSTSLSYRKLNEVYYYVAKIYLRKKEFQKFDFILSYALKIFPNDEKLNLLMAFNYEMKNNMQASAEYYRRVLKINPNSKDAILGSSRILK